MNRHVLRALPQFASCEVVVGWDPVNATFFGYVLDQQAAEGVDPWLVNLGLERGQVLRPEVVLDAVRPYAVVPTLLVDELAAQMPTAAGGVEATEQ